MAANARLMVGLWIGLTATVQAATRVALVSTCGGGSAGNVLALAEAKLSSATNIVLVERSQVERVLNEQKLVRCGLSDSAQALAVGKLLGAQVFATVETFPGSEETLGLVVFDARSGARLWDAALPAGGVEAASEGILKAVQEACAKYLRPISSRRTVCLLSVRNAELPRVMDSFCESVGRLLEQGLLGSPSVTVLERERLDRINQERTLPTNELPGDLLPSLTLMELELSRGGETNEVKAAVILTDAAGVSLGKVQVGGNAERVAELVEMLLQRLAESLKATPSVRRVDRAREAQRFREEANFFIKHMQFAKGLQASEAAYALDPANEEASPLLAIALLKSASDLLAPGQPETYSYATKTTPDSLRRALNLALRGADRCLESCAQRSSVGRLSFPGVSGEQLAFYFFLLRARNVTGIYDDESRQLLASLQTRYRRILIEYWEKPVLASLNSSSRFNDWSFDFYWLLNDLELASPTSGAWTTDAMGALDRWRSLGEELGWCNVIKVDSANWMLSPIVNWMLTPIVYRIKQPTKMYMGCRGECWSLSDADLAQLQGMFERFKHQPDPLLRIYGMAGQLAAALRREPGNNEAIAARLEEIKRVGREAIINPPCARPDDYRVAVYQVLLDTIDLLDDSVSCRMEYHELFEFMLVRREYVHWVAMAAVDPKTRPYAAYQFRSSVFPRGEPAKGDPALCAQDLERLIPLIESPDCRYLSAPLPSWRGPIIQQLAQLRVALAAQEPDLKLPTQAPWDAARLLYDDPRPLLQPRVFGDSVWGLEVARVGRSAELLHLVRIPLDDKPPQRYVRIPPDGPPDKLYAAIVKEGILVFPPDAGAVGRLTETNGLPSRHVSTVACCTGRLYAGIGMNTGYEGMPGYLIRCELATGRISVLASSQRKEKLSALDDVSPPFFIRQMVADPARDRVLFTVDVGVFQRGTAYTGLWSVDTKDDKLTLLVPLTSSCEWMSQIRGSEILLALRTQKTGAAYSVISYNLETNAAKLLYASSWSEADKALIGDGRVCKIPWATYPPHLILDDHLWVAQPFSRIPSDGGPPEFLPSFAGGREFRSGEWRLLEPLGNGRQILVGVGNQLWLLDLKSAAKDSP